MALHELLSVGRDEVIQHWMKSVRGTLAPESMPRLELMDHVPQFVDEVVAALVLSTSPENSATAPQHGVQRLALGFDVDSVVREYGALKNCILDAAEAAELTLTAREQRVLGDCVVTGIADALAEYVRRRDAEVQRLANEHFAFLGHELRNSLASAFAGFELHRRETPGDARATSVLERELLRMKDLIDGSLRSTRVASSLTLNLERVMLGDLLGDVAADATSFAEAKEIKLLFQRDEDFEMFVDLRLVRSTLTNLVRNAVKFTHAGATVEVRSKRADDGRTIIAVEDCCGGLPAGDVERIFLPFVQQGVDRTGFGLGLAIAKQAVDAHGGVLRVQDLPGKGCIFILELPPSETPP